MFFFVILCLVADWVSLNKCVVLCSECASVHRSLGSHISYVKPMMLLKNSAQFKVGLLADRTLT